MLWNERSVSETLRHLCFSVYLMTWTIDKAVPSDFPFCPISALKEAKVPPGPRLLILHHLDQFRNPSSLLKPALPLPPLPPPTDQLVVRR